MMHGQASVLGLIKLFPMTRAESPFWSVPLNAPSVVLALLAFLYGHILEPIFTTTMWYHTCGENAVLIDAAKR
jgi:hypothetical protein